MRQQFWDMRIEAHKRAVSLDSVFRKFKSPDAAWTVGKQKFGLDKIHGVLQTNAKVVKESMDEMCAEMIFDLLHALVLLAKHI